MNYLAFDLGGSSGRLMLGTFEDGKLSLRTVHRFENGPMEEGGALIWDIDRIVSELYAGIEKAVRETGDNIDGIGFDSFCNDYVLIGTDGERLAPAYCYRDARTLRNEASMYGIMSKEALYMVNGNQNAPFNTLNQLNAAFSEGQGTIIAEAYKALFMSDYFVYLLTGKLQTEYTTASVTQMYDYGKGDWSDEILDRYGIRRDLFAPFAVPGTLAGHTSEEFNRKVGTKGFPVYTVCQHDTASAFLASKGGPDTGIISTGTWCIAGLETEGPVITREGFKINAANEGGFPGAHHRLLKNVMGTWILQEIRRELNGYGIDLSYGDMEDLALKRKDTKGYIDVDDPRLYLPGDMISKVRTNLHAKTGQITMNMGSLVFIVYKSLAFKYRLIFDQLEALTGNKLTHINMIGGGIKSPLMCSLTADITGLPVTAGPEDASCAGNILAQMAASGQIASIEEGRQIISGSFPAKTYGPSQENIYDGEYLKFLRH